MIKTMEQTQGVFCLFVWVEALCPTQRLFSHVGTESPPPHRVSLMITVYFSIKTMSRFNVCLRRIIGKQIEPEDQWSCKRSPDILAK